MIRGRRGSVALEAAVTLGISIVILVTLLGALISVIASDDSDWEALHTKDLVSSVYGSLASAPRLNLSTCLVAASADYSRRLEAGRMCGYSGVSASVDDYGFLKLEFQYRPVLKGFRGEERIVLPAGGIHMSDGIDFTKEIVYVTRTGERYHEGTCFHLRKSKFGMEREEAKKKGYTPCKNCH
ncbi:MAG: hypothetical protein Q4A41_01420 [Bacillota bacterium]|nr:hypothetical protein [Bacillota bacterium]